MKIPFDLELLICTCFMHRIMSYHPDIDIILLTIPFDLFTFSLSRRLLVAKQMKST